MDRPSAIYESEKQLKALSDVLEGKEYKNTSATNGESKWLKYIAEQIEKNGVGGSSVQPDWNQNDQSADDYIKNRPFYESIQSVTLLDGTFEFVIDSGMYIAQPKFTYDLIEGETYTVAFDNVAYQCSAIKINGEACVLGNLSIAGAGDNTGEPFIISCTSTNDMIATNTSEGGHSVSVVGNAIVITKVPEKYLPPVIGRVGTNDNSEIFNSYDLNVASGKSSHAEGFQTTASGINSHAEGWVTTASGNTSHAEGWKTTASGAYSHAEGSSTTASGKNSHAEGTYTLASSDNQHVQGKYNIKDTANIYAHIVGNGSFSSDGTGRSNAHTLDWNGNAWYAGTVEGTAMIVKSSTEGSSKRFKITVDDSGVITATEITA